MGWFANWAFESGFWDPESPPYLNPLLIIYFTIAGACLIQFTVGEVIDWWTGQGPWKKTDSHDPISFDI